MPRRKIKRYVAPHPYTDEELRRADLADKIHDARTAERHARELDRGAPAHHYGMTAQQLRAYAAKMKSEFRHGRGRANPAVTIFRANAGPHSPVKVRAHRRDMPRPKRKMRKARKNPGTVVLSRRAVSLAYLHAERGHKSPKGTPYIHKFATGVTVQLLSDGSVRLYRPDRKPLWQRFED